MNFIKIGHTYLNLDNVLAVEPSRNGQDVTVQFGFASNDNTSSFMQLTGSEAADLLRWLDLVATDTTGATNGN